MRSPEGGIIRKMLRDRGLRPLAVSFCLLMEFVEGFDLADCVGHPPLFSQMLRLSSSPELETIDSGDPMATEHRLRDIGLLCALDLFTNNFDRLPTIWKNAGNLGNIRISEPDQVVVGTLFSY
jgi:hypothetical protein